MCICPYTRADNTQLQHCNKFFFAIDGWRKADLHVDVHEVGVFDVVMVVRAPPDGLSDPMP